MNLKIMFDVQTNYVIIKISLRVLKNILLFMKNSGGSYV